MLTLCMLAISKACVTWQSVVMLVLSIMVQNELSACLSICLCRIVSWPMSLRLAVCLCTGPYEGPSVSNCMIVCIRLTVCARFCYVCLSFYAAVCGVRLSIRVQLAFCS